MNAIARNVREYIGRYVVVATVVLLPLSGLLGQLAADWGGTDTATGRVVLGAASVIGTAAAVGVWLRNLGLWETAPIVAQATAEAAAAVAPAAPASVIVHAGQPPTFEVGSGELDTLPALEDPEAEGVPAGELPSDDEELAAPPAPDPDRELEDPELASRVPPDPPEGDRVG